MTATKATTDHYEIRRYVERTGGWPARVSHTGSGQDPGILQIAYEHAGTPDTLERLSWETFFEWFERNELAFVYQPDSLRRFARLVQRESIDLDG